LMEEPASRAADCGGEGWRKKERRSMRHASAQSTEGPLDVMVLY
jgi:hypothetical protein